MKKLITFLLVCSLVLSLASCGVRPPEEERPTSATGATTTEGVTTPTAVLQDQLQQVAQATHYDWADDLPRMDGSTSTIPLEAGIRAALFGISQAEAELQVKHSTTYGSFYNLIDKKCDLIFSVPLSENQISQARDKGMELEMTKIAAEGFVFVVNAQNPVDTLTQQQLKDIYSGKITNWAEVGGHDAPIVAYQRNETSGSQNFMHTFMADTTLMDPLTSAAHTPASMGQLMDAIAVYDNAEYAIGYSVYAYAADMYGNGNEIKFIHVDGVEPTKATMADGSYPLLSYNYAVYDAATPADSSLRKLVDWLTTDEGQRAVQAAGYVPLRPVGDVTETAVRLYSAVGTGPEKPENHVPSLYIYTARDTNLVDHLTNQALREEIRTFIDDSVEELKKPEDAVGCTTRIECVNGYLSVHIYSGNSSGTDYDGRTALFDLVAGKRIAFSDLFFKDVHYIDEINVDMAEQSREQTWFWDEDDQQCMADRYPIKRDFVGIAAGHDTFTLTSVVFPRENLYFANAVTLNFHGLYDCMVLSVPRDMAGLFDSTVTVYRTFAQEDAFYTSEKLLHEHYAALFLDAAHYEAAVCQKVNDAMRAYYARDCSDEELLDLALRIDGVQGEIHSEGVVAYLQILGGRYVSARGEDFSWVEKADSTPLSKMVNLSNKYQYFFDLKTGEKIPYTAFLKDGWQSAGEWSRMVFVEGGESGSIGTPDLTGARLMQMVRTNAGWKLEFRYADIMDGGVSITIPDEYIQLDK